MKWPLEVDAGLKGEVEQIVTSSNKSTDPFALRRTLVARLVVFHLVDNTRGQVWPYRLQDVSRAEFTARRTRDAGPIRTLSLAGNYAKRDSHHLCSLAVEWRTHADFPGQKMGALVVNGREFSRYLPRSLPARRQLPYALAPGWKNAVKYVDSLLLRGTAGRHGMPRQVEGRRAGAGDDVPQGTLLSGSAPRLRASPQRSWQWQGEGHSFAPRLEGC